MSAEDATDIINLVQSYTPTTVAHEDAAETSHENVVAEHTDAVKADVAPVGVEEESLFQKATHFVEDYLPDGMKEKAEGMLGGLGDKVKGLFS
jgi:hypothetical protein